MRISRRTFLLAAAAAGCSRFSDTTPLQKAAQFLWSQQNSDGGFHSATYGLLRSGQSLTPFVLDALLDVSESVLPAKPQAIDRALSFIKQYTNADGALGQMDETAADYPNYATALAVRVLAKAGRSGGPDIAPMVAHLRAQQFGESNGWHRDDPPYGAWGMGGPIHRPPETGHVDLSMTRYVLEALRTSGVPTSDPAVTAALVYLERSQNSDGGFFFSTVNPEINKAGDTNGVFSATVRPLPMVCWRYARPAYVMKIHGRPQRFAGSKIITSPIARPDSTEPHASLGHRDCVFTTAPSSRKPNLRCL